MTIIRNWTESSPSTPSVSMEHALYTADGWGRGAMSAKPTDLTVEIMQTSQMRESVPPQLKRTPQDLQIQQKSAGSCFSPLDPCLLWIKASNDTSKER